MRQKPEFIPAIPDILSLKRRESLSELIANTIAEAIAARQMVAGERIVETSLASRFAVSRVPVREALKVLHTQGIIDGGGHRGYRVASFSPRMVQSVQEARLELETLILRDAIAAWQNGSADPVLLEGAIATMRAAARLNDFQAMLRADLAFHQVIVDAAANPIFATLWLAIARHVLIILNLARFRDIDLRMVVRRHEALRDQIMAQVEQRGAVPQTRALLQAHFLADRTQHGTEASPGAAPLRRRTPRAG
jgi:DNA-binding GntR family transcriptional regulator